jgi:hypothetical protein
MQKSSKTAQKEIHKLNTLIEDLQVASSKKDESLLFNENLNQSLSSFNNDSSILHGNPKNFSNVSMSSPKRRVNLKLPNQKTARQAEDNVQALRHFD